MFLFVRFQREREMGTRTRTLMVTNAARDRCTALWDFWGTRNLGNNSAFMGVSLWQKKHKKPHVYQKNVCEIISFWPEVCVKFPNMELLVSFINTLHFI